MSEPLELIALFAFSSQVTENYLRRTLRLLPATILTISSPIFMNANLSNTRSTYAMAGALPHATYTFESSHSAPNDNILARSVSSSTNTINTYLPSSSDPSATSSSSTIH